MNNDRRNQLRKKIQDRQLKDTVNNVIHSNGTETKSLPQWNDLSAEEKEAYIQEYRKTNPNASITTIINDYSRKAIKSGTKPTPISSQSNPTPPQKVDDNEVPKTPEYVTEPFHGKPTDSPEDPSGDNKIKITPTGELSEKPNNTIQPIPEINPDDTDTGTKVNPDDLPLVTRPFERVPDKNDQMRKGEGDTFVKEEPEQPNTNTSEERKEKQEQLRDKIKLRNSDRINQAQSEYDAAQKALAEAEKKYTSNPTEENKKARDKAQETVNQKHNELSGTKDNEVGYNSEFLKSSRKKYKNPRTLVASQDNPAEMKYINFKQDYVVLIRKKPFYAATAQQRYASADVFIDHADGSGETQIQTKGEKLKDKSGRDIEAENNYLRVYQVNNFINISINTTVNAPGTCSVTMKGAERVVCAENEQQSKFGFYSWSDLAGSWLDINEHGTANDGTGIAYTTGSAFNNEKIAKQNREDLTTGKVTYEDSSNRKEIFSGIKRKTGQSWKEATNIWDGVEKGLFEEG